MNPVEAVDVVVVGGGPAGLGAAIELRRRGVERVVVLEREPIAGGIPRHTDHLGFGARDLHRVLTGPAYAARLVTRATRAGADVRTGTTLVDCTGELAVGGDDDDDDDDGGGIVMTVHHADGLRTLSARAVVLATGTRERPRSARLVPGARPLGVYTTAAVQQLVALHGVVPGRRAVVVGAEHVSFSAIDTLAHGGCRTVAVVTPFGHHQTYAPLAWATASRRRVPVLTDVDVTGIEGTSRVSAVTLSDGRRIDCDTVVFTGDWVPEHDVVRRAGVTLDAGWRAPSVDGGLRSDRPGVFAAGNLVHGALQADWCALDGRHVAAAVTRWLVDHRWPEPTVPIEVAAPLRWSAPHRLTANEPLPQGRLVLCAGSRMGYATVTVSQGPTVLWRGRPRTPIAPTRPFTIDAAWVARLDPDGGPVTVAAG